MGAFDKIKNGLEEAIAYEQSLQRTEVSHYIIV